MAIFRKIHTSFWSDPFIQDLDNDHRLFYLYLLTNEKTKQCGIYEISKKQIAFELGYSIDRVSKLFQYFIKSGKILYSDDTKEVALKNWMKYNSSTSPKVISCIKSELCNIKDRVLIEYVNGMYTASQEEEEQEQEQEEEQTEKKKRFVKPTQNEVLEYMAELRMADMSQRFVDYYESNGWKVGKNPMKDWRAAVRTWKQQSDNKTTPTTQSTTYKKLKIENYHVD
jgi:hypothetical protein